MASEREIAFARYWEGKKHETGLFINDDGEVRYAESEA